MRDMLVRAVMLGPVFAADLVAVLTGSLLNRPN
jgi:hypothetical protein